MTKEALETQQTQNWKKNLTTDFPGFGSMLAVQQVSNYKQTEVFNMTWYQLKTLNLYAWIN